MSNRWIRGRVEITLVYAGGATMTTTATAWRGSPWDGDFEMQEDGAAFTFFTETNLAGIQIREVAEPLAASLVGGEQHG